MAGTRVWQDPGSPRVIRWQEISGRGLPGFQWGAKRPSHLLGRWFCPWQAVTTGMWCRLGPAPPRRPPYLFTTLSDGGRELTDYHVHTLDTGLFELLHLLFHCGFKSEVRCEEARPAPEEEGEEGEEGAAGEGTRMGVKAKWPGSRVGEDGQAWGEERDTNKEREKEREQKTP